MCNKNVQTQQILDHNSISAWILSDENWSLARNHVDIALGHSWIYIQAPLPYSPLKDSLIFVLKMLTSR